jgi:uroporphyrinogen-III synthase
MRPTGAHRTVVLLASRGAFQGLETALGRSGLGLVRITSAEPRPIEPERWLPRLTAGPDPDTVVVTSRAAVLAGVRPWQRSAAGPGRRRVEYWAAGPTTARALRAQGVRRVRRAGPLGSAGIARSIAESPPRSIVYFRSDRAGPALARTLRRRGHRVIDLAVYRTAPARPATDRERRAILAADLLVVTSPSGLEWLMGSLDRSSRDRLRRGARLVVLGPKSHRAARKLGFRGVSVAPSPSPERFTRHLLRGLRDADP